MATKPTITVRVENIDAVKRKLDELLQFVEDTRTMRKWQNRYFADRTQVNMRSAKDCERKVDAAIRRLTTPQLDFGGK